LAGLVEDVSQHPQQTGVPLTITQQLQPAATRPAMQSQHAWIISQHLASPLVQVMQTPLSVVSHLQKPIVRLQQQTVRPFMVRQQLTAPPASMAHRFCTMPQAILSSQTQVIFRPPVHFSNLTVHRGTIIQPAPATPPVGVPMGLVPMPGTVTPGIPIPVRSIITALDMG
jgi:hypothetical protein